MNRKKSVWARLAGRWKKTLADRRKKMALILLPVVSALIVYGIHYKGDPLYTLYSSIKVYAAGCDIELEELHAMRDALGNDFFGRACYYAYRLGVEIARWGGLAVTGTFLFRIVRDYFEHMKVAREIKREKVVAVHGSEYYRKLLGETFGADAVTQDYPEKFAAAKHILAFDQDRELLDYLNRNMPSFPRSGEVGNDKRMFLCLLSSSHTKYSSEGFIVNNIAENCARLYWEDHFVRQFGGHAEKRIVIIGFGDYGQALLSQALLVNVFLPGRPPMEYHVFGDSSRFYNLHRDIAKFVSVNEKSDTLDSVFFHEDDWENNIALINSADRLILAGDQDEDNICLLGWIQEHSLHADIHVRIHDERIIAALYPQVNVQGENGQRVYVFGSDRTLYTREVILEEALLRSAKQIHASYMRRTDSRCKTCPNNAGSLDACVGSCGFFVRDWNAQSLFIQRSNVCAADHMDVKVRQVIGEDCVITQGAIERYKAALARMREAGETLPLMELEHRRWLRYHYFWGWSYAEKTNRQEKQHRLIIPFDQLETPDRDKNIDAYEQIEEIDLGERRA